MEKNICFQAKRVIIFKQGGILAFLNVAVLRNSGGFLVFFYQFIKHRRFFLLRYGLIENSPHL